MIIWIDGTYGVGKTTISQKLKSQLTEKNFEILNADYYFQNMLKSNPLIGGGTTPQNNIPFINFFRDLIEHKIAENQLNLIVDMSLTQKECKEMLFDILIKKYTNIKHFILIANSKTIQLRIQNSIRQDKKLALYYLESNNKFLTENFKDSIRIDTEKNIDEIVNEIINFL